jgi:hypothetical protein
VLKQAQFSDIINIKVYILHYPIQEDKMEFATKNRNETPGLFSRKFWVLAAGSLLVMFAVLMVTTPVSAASNTTLTFSGNLQQQVSVSSTGNATPFNLGLGQNEFNNRSLIISSNVPIRIKGTDVTAGKQAGNAGFFGLFDGMFYSSTRLSQPFNVSISVFTPSNLVFPSNLSPTMPPGVSVNLPIKVNQFVDWSDTVAPSGSVYRADIDFMAVVV